MTLLNEIVHDLSSGAYSTSFILTPEHGLQGPHHWHEMTSSDFGIKWDFELENHITKWIITPISRAALEWLYCHLPEDCPRFGALGFIVEARYLEQIVNHMKQDNLMTPEDYEQAMEEASQLAHQWDDQDG